MKAILVIDMPKSCEECDYLGWATHDEDMRACMLLNGYFFNEEEVETKRSEVCPLKHPLKYASKDFYIYDTKYLMENLDREINLLNGAKAFEEIMEKQNESNISD